MEPPDSVQSLIDVGFYEFGQYQSSWLCGFSLAVPRTKCRVREARSWVVKDGNFYQTVAEGQRIIGVFSVIMRVAEAFDLGF